MAGALDDLTTLYRDYQDARSREYKDSQSILKEGIGTFSQPRRNYAGLKMAAGFLSPTRSGSFGESLGKAVDGYADASERYEDGEMTRAEKLMRLRLANAKLGADYAGGNVSSALQQLEIPGKVLKAREDQIDLQDLNSPGGGSPVPYPTGSSPRAPASAATPRRIPGSAPVGPAPGRFSQREEPTLARVAALAQTGEAPTQFLADGGPVDLFSSQPMMDYSMPEEAPQAAPVPQAKQPTGSFTPEVADWSRQVLQAATDPANERYYRSRRGKTEIQRAQQIYNMTRKEEVDAERLALRDRNMDLREQLARAQGADKAQTEAMKNKLAAARNMYRRIVGDPDTQQEGMMDQYKKIIGETGVEIMPGQDKDRAGGSYTSMLMALKDMHELGAITGPDLPLLQAMIPKPTVDNPLELGNAWDTSGRASSAMDRLKKEMEIRMNAYEQTYGGTAPQTVGIPAPAAPIKVTSEAEYQQLKPGTPYIAPDGSKRIKQ